MSERGMKEKKGNDGKKEKEGFGGGAYRHIECNSEVQKKSTLVEMKCLIYNLFYYVMFNYIYSKETISTDLSPNLEKVCDPVLVAVSQLSGKLSQSLSTEM